MVTSRTYQHFELAEAHLCTTRMTQSCGKGVTANSNIAIWRERGTHRPMCGEFAFQAKFKRRDELHEKAMDRCRQFFITLQQAGRDWLYLGTTKTGLVYRLLRAIRPRAMSDRRALILRGKTK